MTKTPVGKQHFIKRFLHVSTFGPPFFNPYICLWISLDVMCAFKFHTILGMTQYCVSVGDVGFDPVNFRH